MPPTPPNGNFKPPPAPSLASQDPGTTPFQIFLRQTPPLAHDPDKPLPPTPGRPKPAAKREESNLPRSAEVLEDDRPRAHHRPIASSISAPDLTLVPPVMSPPHIAPTNKIETVSLQQAKEARDAPGAVRFLPEELCAKNNGHAKMSGHVRVHPLGVLGAVHAPETPPVSTAATLVDDRGRQRRASTPLPAPAASLTTARQKYPFSGPSRFASQNAHDSCSSAKLGDDDDDSCSSAGPYDDDDHRGRRKERGRLGQDQWPAVSEAARKSSSVAACQSRENSESRHLPDEYTALLAQQDKPCSDTGYDSDDSIRTHMKMVPQPLFTGMSAPLRGSGPSRSTRHKRTKSHESLRPGNFPLSISLTPTLRQRASEGSTTGIIPISPPTNMREHSPQATHLSVFPTPPRLPPPIPKSKPLSILESKPQKSSRKNRRESQFYPHIMRRKSSQKSQSKNGRSCINGNPATPQLPARQLSPPAVMAQQFKTPLQTPGATHQMSPLGSNPATSLHKRGPSNGSPEKSKKTFYERIKGTARHGGRRRSSDNDNRDTSPSAQSSPSIITLSPASPPRPDTSHEIHLGWSDSAKQEYDDARALPAPPGRTGRMKVTHVALPARPLDGRKDGLADASDSATSAPRGPSRFGALSHRWNGNKAEKRRRDLKKLITLVPNLSTSTIPSEAPRETAKVEGGTSG